MDKVSSAVAAGAYKNVQQGVQKPGGIAAEEGDNSFMNMIKKAAVSSIDTMRAGEKASADAVVGKANLTDVVDAITNAELTLQTVVAVRDRMMSAYQEIMRMPV